MLETSLRSAAERMPVVTVTGPRQSGKTTLVRCVFPHHHYINLERPDLRARAVEDPLAMLRQYQDGLILDEVQKVPELLSFVQAMVDEVPSPGRFVLTGSQNLLLLDKISQTLAGRTRILELLPLTLRELRASDSQPEPHSAKDMGLWETVWRGFYPRVHDQKLNPTDWYADYVQTYVERDLRDTLRVFDLSLFSTFLRGCAAQTGQLVNLSTLSSDVGVSQPTARQWLSALSTGYIVCSLPSHHVNFRKRIRKQPKLHFLDTGLLCYLLGIHDPQVLATHPLRGSIFESFVFGELYKTLLHQVVRARLFHWRDSSNHEIDLLIDNGRTLFPVEAKSATTYHPDFAETLRWWFNLHGNANRQGAIVYGGNEPLKHSNIEVLPWTDVARLIDFLESTF